MEGLTVLVIVAILFGYLNLWLIIRREKPNIIVNFKLPEKLFKYESLPADKNAKFVEGSTGTASEVPIDTLTTIKDVDGDINLDSEKLDTSNVSEITNKIKKFRGDKR